VNPVSDRHAAAWREAFTRVKGTAETGPQCPPAERVWATATGEASPAETRGLLDHASRCEACTEAWALALSMAREAGLAVSPLSAEAPAPVWRSWFVWAPTLAAAALIALGLWIDYRHVPGDRAAPRWRGPTPAADIRSLVPEDRPLARDAAVLRWTAGGPGTRYNVRVLSGDLALVARADGLDTPEYRVAPTALSRVPAGARLLWQVESVDKDGKRRTSPTFFVRVE
jgi:hypothetical protein